jgi:hypothetical protein
MYFPGRQQHYLSEYVIVVEMPLFWFRTQDDLLEEWGYTPGFWHIVTRSDAFMTAIAVDSRGKPDRHAKGDLLLLPNTRVLLSQLTEALCEFRGPFDAARASRFKEVITPFSRPAAA